MSRVSEKVISSSGKDESFKGFEISILYRGSSDDKESQQFFKAVKSFADTYNFGVKDIKIRKYDFNRADSLRSVLFIDMGKVNKYLPMDYFKIRQTVSKMTNKQVNVSIKFYGEQEDFMAKCDIYEKM